jgi:hypothetical protein
MLLDPFLLENQWEWHMTTINIGDNVIIRDENGWDRSRTERFHFLHYDCVPAFTKL